MAATLCGRVVAAVFNWIGNHVSGGSAAEDLSKRRANSVSLQGEAVRVQGMADVHVEIDRLERDGVRFSIAARGDVFVARVGDYLSGPTESREVLTFEEAVRWVATVARQLPNVGLSRVV